jgi:flagellar hook-basal body complex protein FliE
MPSGRIRLCVAVLIAASLATAACGADPPEKEIQQAQGAIDAARDAGADEYAHDEFAAAEGALKRAREAVDQRDYRLALNNALDSRERAQNAARDAADQKTTARIEAERALAAASAALARTKARLKAAETARAAARTLSEARRSVADGDKAVQKARAAFDLGNYRDVTKTLNGSTARLAATARDLDAVPGPAPRRRR